MFGNFDTQVLIKNHALLLNGMLISLELTAIAAVFGMVIGCVLAFMRLSRLLVVAWIATAYVNLLRSVPLILVIFWFYMLVPKVVGHPTGAFTSVMIAFVLFEAAYYCEIVRAGIAGIRRGQAQAGLALGFRPTQVMRYVILPQAIRTMVPVLLSQVIVMFQDTSLVYIVGVRDFLTAAEVVADTNNRPLELYTTVAVVFLAICLTASLLVARLRPRTAR
jgi:glutamate/aspartate transport system permease protein